MYIKSMVMDGFKSYGCKVKIDEFDKEFNAITGLNGTGKSNILDGICFLLGITNLAHVRALSLQDLIYKNEQSNVTKATVTITFDNSNKAQSPPGFENFDDITVTRQVNMGGKNRYMINGNVVQNKKVQDMFCSVQLNVNNPHFLIMQGRVTKVLNMRPLEILAMLEEAAGTRMYETKRQLTQKCIERKDARLHELQRVIDEELNPKLEKLRRERQAYLEFQRIEMELEHISSIHKAWTFSSSRQVTAEAKERLRICEEKLKNIKENIGENMLAIHSITAEVNDLKKNNLAKCGENVSALEEQVKEIQKADALVYAKENSANDHIAGEERRIALLVKNCKADEAALTMKEQSIQEINNLFNEIKSNEKRYEAAFELSQKKYLAICNGMEINEAGESESLHQQLMNAKEEASNAVTEMQTTSMELKHLENELILKEQQLGMDSSDYNRNQASLEQVATEVQNLETKLSKLVFNEEQYLELRTTWKELHDGIRADRHRIFEIESRRPNLRFSYHNPEANFDPSRVHGVVCKLFEVVYTKFYTALEIVAGSKLFNVVVEDDVTGRLLLQKGQLQTRTTFIPLNKIRGETIDENTVRFAENLVGKENIHTALSLIKYDARLHKAMAYIFGNVFVCANLNIAKKVTFHERIKKKCVTIDGDVTDPGGVLSGGAMQKGTPLLRIIADLIKLENKVREKEGIFRNVAAEYKRWTEVKDSIIDPTIQEKELKQMELENVKRCLQQTSHHKLQQEVDLLKENIANLTEQLKTIDETERRSSAKVKMLQNMMLDSKGHNERQMKEAELEMNAMRAKTEQCQREWQKYEQQFETLNLEISELKKSMVDTLVLLEYGRRSMELSMYELQVLHTDARLFSVELNVQKDNLRQAKLEMALQEKDVDDRLAEKERLIKSNYELDLDMKRCELELAKLQLELQEAQTNEADVASKMKQCDNENIQMAEDMTIVEAQRLKEKVDVATENRNRLSRTINAKAQSMFEEEEKRYTILMKKFNIVKEDRESLIKVLQDLDEKKRVAVQLAYDQVKQDFGSIFGSLLPGSLASLAPPHGKTIMDGLEVQVNLGGVWKDSLTELSGGQRSLIALSLILAMLLFKPAPLYILDEVDAALDLSHTQNIGHMLKSHFKQSQFIVVSLKDGMFNNANVLFKTQFIDGTSSVIRTVNEK